MPVGESEALRRLAERLVAPAPGPAAPFGAYCFGAADPSADLARAVEGEVFLDRFGNTDEEMALEYGPYDEASLFFVVLDHARQLPAGAMRLIASVPGGAGLKTWNDLGRLWGPGAPAWIEASHRGRAPERTWEIASLAVSRAYQNPLGAGLVSAGLYQSVVRSCLALGVENLVAVLDGTVHRMTRRRYAEPFIEFAPPRPYLGSRRSFPVYCTLGEWEERLLVTDAETHGIIYGGVGLEHALTPLDLSVLPGLIARSTALLALVALGPSPRHPVPASPRAPLERRGRAARVRVAAG